MISKLPVSLAWFALTALIYLLQWIPFTGIFLMLLAAPFWSVITVNAGFVFLGVEALVRPGYRLWLVAPALYFGGYATYAHLSHQEFARMDADLRAFNAGKSVAFDPRANDLLLEEKSQGLSSGALSFVRNYNLDVVYVASRNFDTARHLSYRLATKKVCDEIRKDADASAAFVRTSGLHFNGRLSKTICSVSGPEDPVRQIVSVSTTRVKENGWLLPATVDTIKLRGADGRETELKTGYAAPLPALPMPVMGCALNSGAPSWDCFLGFSRLRQQGLGATGSYGTAIIPVVATALGLNEITDAERQEKAIAQRPTALQSNIGKRIDFSLANLDKIIADPSVRLTLHDIRGLRERPDLWRHLVPDMLATFERALDGGHSTRERANMLQDLFIALPDKEFVDVGKRILQAFLSRPDLSDNFLRERTLGRLADLGPISLPFLEAKLTAVKRLPPIPLMLGLCRIGAPAARLADILANKIIPHVDRGSGSQQFVAFVTLMKWDRPELAEHAFGKRMADHGVITYVRRSIAQGRVSDLCRSENDWKKEKLDADRAANRR